MNPSDGTLLERWLAHRDAEAFAELVARHSTMVYGACRRILRNEADACEVAQECFVTLIRSAPAPRRDAASFGGWLHTVATRLALNRVREQRRRRLREERYAVARASHDEAPAVDDVAARVDEALSDLPTDLREPLILHFLEGLSHADTAARLGLPRRTVTGRIARGIDEVRHRLRHEGVMLSGSALASLLTVESAEAAPAALTATLGKLALADASLVPALQATGTGVALLGGLVMTKTAGIAAGALAAMAIAVAAVFLVQEREASRQAPVSVKTSAETLPEPNVKRPAVRVVAQGLTVAGTVVDSANRPVPEAKVALRRVDAPDRVVSSEPSGPDGSFVLPAPRVGAAFRLEAEKEGWVPVPSGRMEMPADGLQGVTVTLCRAATVEGIVVDGRNRPLSDWVVTATSGSAAAAQGGTDAGGRFSVAGLLPGTHSLAALPADNEPRRDLEDARVDLKEGQRLTGVRIVCAGEEPFVAGRVTNEEGDPVGNVRVQCLHKDLAPSARTAADGRYHLARLPVKGSVLLSLGHPDYAASLEHAETGRDDADFVLRGLKSGTVSGRAVDAVSLVPIQDFEVTYHAGVWAGVDWSAEGSYRRFHDEQGRFELEGVPSGEATVVARAEDYAPAFVPVRLEESGVGEVLVPLVRGHVVQGVVMTVEGTPVAGASLFTGEAQPFDAWKREAMQKQPSRDSNTSDAEGRFMLRGLAPGPQVITAMHKTLGMGNANVDSGSAAARDLRIVIGPGGTIAGKVTVGGQPATGATVSVLLDPQLQGYAGANIDVEPDGTYRCTGVPEATVTVGVTLGGVPPAEAHRRSTRSVSVRHNETVDASFDFAAGAAQVEGSVTVQGQPAERAIVRLFMDGPYGREISKTETYGSGSYSFENLPAGRATLKAFVMPDTPKTVGSNWVPVRVEKNATVDVPAGGTVRCDIDLSGMLSISGRVTGLDPLERATLYLLEGAPDLIGFDQSMLSDLQLLVRGWTQPDPKGDYRLHGFESGTYTLLAIATTATLHGEFSDMRYAAAPVDLQDPPGCSVDFDLR